MRYFGLLESTFKERINPIVDYVWKQVKPENDEDQPLGDREIIAKRFKDSVQSSLQDFVNHSGINQDIPDSTFGKYLRFNWWSRLKNWGDIWGFLAKREEIYGRYWGEPYGEPSELIHFHNTPEGGLNSFQCGFLSHEKSSILESVSMPYRMDIEGDIVPHYFKSISCLLVFTWGWRCWRWL